MVHSGTMRARGLLFFLALLGMALLTSACMKKPLLLCHPHHFYVMEKEAIEMGIIRLETTFDKHLDNSINPESYFQLALLYAHYNNPEPNYPLSLNMFEKYLVFDPQSKENDEALYLKTLLQKLVETDKEGALFKNETEILKQKSEKLKEKNEKLVLENQDLRDSIEKLKLLELRLEENRLNSK